MNHWIEGSRPVLDALLKRVDMLVVNDEEAELLTGDRNMIKAAGKILDSGPSSVLIKRGEYGVIEFSGDSIFAVPAYPLEEVCDPTGAGDCFAAGVMGELARSGDTSPSRDCVGQSSTAVSWARSSSRILDPSDSRA